MGTTINNIYLLLYAFISKCRPFYFLTYETHINDPKKEFMAESTILWTHCTVNCNDTALKMACARTPFLHRKPNGAVRDPHGSTCCSSGCSSLCPCMFFSSSPSGVSLSVSVPSHFHHLYQLLSSLNTLTCFSHFFISWGKRGCSVPSSFHDNYEK